MANSKNESLRKKYERATMPIGALFAKIGLTPNMVTALSILVAIISLYFFYMRIILYAFVIILIAGILDILDGAVARATGKTSKFGTLLDNTADRIVEGIIIIGLIMADLVSSILATTALLAMFLPSYIRARGEAELRVNARGIGIVERKEKMAILFGIIIIAYLRPDIPSVYIFVGSVSVSDLLLIILIIGSSISALQRILFFRGIKKRKINNKSF